MKTIFRYIDAILWVLKHRAKLVSRWSQYAHSITWIVLLGQGQWDAGAWLWKSIC